MNDYKKQDFLTIRQTLNRADEDGLHMSEPFLRELVRSGKIPHRATGNRVYIYYPNFVKYITGGEAVGRSA